MALLKHGDRTAVSALRVHQWLSEWDQVPFDASKHRAKPEPFFYLFSMPAADLRALSGIYARSTQARKRGSDDLGIQRRHDPTRSDEIRRFVHYGHPWAGLSVAQGKSEEYADLKKPGWLPTAIVVNILKPADERQTKAVLPEDLVDVRTEHGNCQVLLPSNYDRSSWRASAIPPIEVIDGQHRLWAFGDGMPDGEYELPVVAFHGLDISWQAYLFYTINIKPKRINASLAFDLYPLLRTEDWLERFEGAIVYRETRAQELVDLLYSHPKSPWRGRINMLGEPGRRGEMVTQAAWVRSLLASYVKSWEGQRVQIGGLFGAPAGSDQQVLPWSRHEQAAFLIVVGRRFAEAVQRADVPWAQALRQAEEPSLFGPSVDLAFWGRSSLISQDQGIRALLSVTNDLCYLGTDELGLAQFGDSRSPEAEDHSLVDTAMVSLKALPVDEFIQEMSRHLALFDWRASSAPGLSQEESLMKAAFRGSGGYRELRRQLLGHLERCTGRVGNLAKQAIERLGY